MEADAMSAVVQRSEDGQSRAVPKTPPTANRLGVPRIERVSRPDGSFVLRSLEPLGDYDRCVGDWLVRWAARTPDATLLAERVDGPGGRAWRRVSYAEALAAVRALGQAILDLDAPPGQPVVAVSDNSVNLGLLGLAAMHVGRPLAVVSSSYVRMTRDHTRVHGILARLEPALVYAEDGAVYGDALDTAGLRCPVAYAARGRAGSREFANLLATPPTSAVDAAFAAIRPDDTAKLLLTSGSTGVPKMVVNTHRMLCANQQMIAQCWPFVVDAAPVVLDWLPWSHTFGANHNFNLVLRNGGALYIDDGRPAPGLVERTVENLLDVRPTLYFNVPRGYDALLPFLEADAGFARAFFERLDALFYAAAALPPSTWDRLARAAAPHRDEPLFFTTAWGATETSPLITSAHFPLDGPGNIGVPAPGLELKFVPSQGKYELRVRGVSVFPSYRGDPERTAAAFDEEGFYCLGDAGRLVDEADPCAGVRFDGRVAEDFKLASGTWVSVNDLRLRVVSALAPLVQDAVVCGHDGDEVGLLLFPSPALRALCGDADGRLDGLGLGRHPAVRGRIAEVLGAIFEGAGSSQRAGRVAILSTPPSLDDGEITDKGYVNQRAVLQCRAHEVERLYSDCDSVIRLG